MIDKSLNIRWYDQGEWAARSRTELARYTLGYSGFAGPDQKSFAGLEVIIDRQVQPVKWMIEVPQGQDALTSGERLLSEWLDAPAPTLRASTEKELLSQQRMFVLLMARLSGKSHNKAYEEYRQASAKQRASMGAEAPGERT